PIERREVLYVLSRTLVDAEVDVPAELAEGDADGGVRLRRREAEVDVVDLEVLPRAAGPPARLDACEPVLGGLPAPPLERLTGDRHPALGEAVPDEDLSALVQLLKVDLAKHCGVVVGLRRELGKTIPPEAQHADLGRDPAV